MPVRRFRSIEEMDDERWYTPGEPALLEAIRAVWDFAARTCPRHFPRGVHKHRTLESMAATREAWAQADFEALWAERISSPGSPRRRR